MTTIPCTALSTFIDFVPDYGVLVGNAGESVEVPEEVFERLVSEGKIESADPLDHDGNGEKGGAKKPAKAKAAPAADEGEGQAPA